jgi:hypothetical protein
MHIEVLNGPIRSCMPNSMRAQVIGTNEEGQSGSDYDFGAVRERSRPSTGKTTSSMFEISGEDEDGGT